MTSSEASGVRWESEGISSSCHRDRRSRTLLLTHRVATRLGRGLILFVRLLLGRRAGRFESRDRRRAASPTVSTGPLASGNTSGESSEFSFSSLTLQIRFARLSVDPFARHADRVCVPFFSPVST